jgi:hypothetical protein
MNEDEAILFLLDLGEGAQRRPDEIDEMVTEMQKSAGISEDTVGEIKNQLYKSDSVTIQMQGMPPLRKL